MFCYPEIRGKQQTTWPITFGSRCPHKKCVSLRVPTGLALLHWCLETTSLPVINFANLLVVTDLSYSDNKHAITPAAAPKVDGFSSSPCPDAPCMEYLPTFGLFLG